MYDVKKVKVLHNDEEVNQYLEQGWIILTIFSPYCFILGLPNTNMG